MKKAKCIFLQGKVIDSRAIQFESCRRIKDENKTFKVVTVSIENYTNDQDNVFDYDRNETLFDALKLKFKKLSKNAIATIRATQDSIGYDIYTVEKCSILQQSKGLFPADIALQCSEKPYERIALRSSVSKKNTDAGARVTGTDYTGNVRVLISNRIAETFNIEAENYKAQFVLRRCKTPDIVKVTDLEQTIRATNDFGSSGI